MWLCYFHALQKGDINKVVPIDKSSTILTILMALIFLHEGLSWEKAVFASLTAILGKIGISGVDSNLDWKKGALVYRAVRYCYRSALLFRRK